MSVIKFPGPSRKKRGECGILERPPKPIMRTPGEEEDPIFAVIDHHRALSSRYGWAVGQYGRVENGPLEQAATEITEETCKDLLDFCDNGLLLTRPTTLAGVAAFIGYVGTLEEYEQPRGEAFCRDKERPSGWFIQLCQMLKGVIKQLDGKI